MNLRAEVAQMFLSFVESKHDFAILSRQEDNRSWAKATAAVKLYRWPKPRTKPLQAEFHGTQDKHAGAPRP